MSSRSNTESQNVGAFSLGHQGLNDDSVRSSPTTDSSGERRNLLERYLVFRRSRSSVSADLNRSIPLSSSSMIRPLGLSRFHPYASPALTASTSSPFSSSSVSLMSNYPESPFMLPSSYSQLNPVQGLSSVDLGESHMIEARILSSYLNSNPAKPSCMTSNNNIASDSQALKELHSVRHNRSYLSALSREARRENDAMVYLEGPRVYSCIHCRTHLTTHDDIISKSFHGRNGRAFLFENCANVVQGPAEDRRLITGLHSVCDITCKRCKTLIGWTYEKAYESSQKYKEGKFIVERIHLFMEENNNYDIDPPAGERRDHWRRRSMS